MFKVKNILNLTTIAVLVYHLFQLSSYWEKLPDLLPFGPKYLLLIMPILGGIFWLFIGSLIKNPDKLNYVNLTRANRERQYKRTKTTAQLIQNTSFSALILTNQAMLKSAVGLSDILPLSLAIVLMVLCVLAPIYLLFWAATLKD